MGNHNIVIASAILGASVIVASLILIAGNRYDYKLKPDGWGRVVDHWTGRVYCVPGGVVYDLDGKKTHTQHYKE